MDLNVRNNCNIDYYSYSLLGECYKPDVKGQGAFCLTGSYNFKVLEIEVYKVLWKLFIINKAIPFICNIYFQLILNWY